ncbi:conserved protein [Tepidicaulis marinus]|uniref:Conserved protein n=1 Tax=Tepidicaulis marinus TaxID=1333998 RepID=A0A081BBL5_9HYPH|nr:hypothetical protein [Tepidicaulis marinus]GAK45433.1 conserved protein [Tepidicaulis marinus]
MTIPAIVEMTDYLGVVGKSFLRCHQRDHAIAELKLPFTFPQIKAEGILHSAVRVGD